MVKTTNYDEPIQLYGTQQIRITDPFVRRVAEHLCHTANNLINTGTYHARQLYFKTGKLIGKHDLSYLLKTDANFQFLYSLSAQSILIGVGEAWQSFKKLKQGVRTWRTAKPPNYRTTGGIATVTYPKQALTIIDGEKVRIPLGKRNKLMFGIGELLAASPFGIEWDRIKELRVLPRNRELYFEWVYTKQRWQADLNFTEALGIDAGVTNWMTCVSTLGRSFIVCGKKIKSINQHYNKLVAHLKKGQDKNFWSDELARITEKRNRQMRDARNKAAMFVISHCLKNRIGNIVFGWNKGVKTESNIGSVNNQNFVQIPTSQLKDRIQELCSEFNIRFFETEEAYTSKSSFLDREPLPKFGEKPEQLRFAGKRPKRGGFCMPKRKIINADANAAANMIRKVMIQLGDAFRINLAKVSRGSLNLPHRYDVFRNQASSYRLHFLYNLTPV